MGINLFIKGLIIGVSIAAPVGPIGILCIKRTLSEGRWAGLVSGLGAACADAIYGMIAGFGITFISNFLVNQQSYFRLIGGMFLFFLGVKTIFSKPAPMQEHLPTKGMAGKFLSTFALTLTNPMTILSLAAIFSGVGLIDPKVGYATAMLLIIGVFCGSALWWLFLSTLVASFRAKLDRIALQWVNRVSGTIILFFSIYLLIRLFF